jgi:hypothetical protein
MGALSLRQELEELALVRRHVVRRETSGGAGLQDWMKYGIGRHQARNEVVVDGGPPQVHTVIVTQG